jgi:hypothetical protein
MGFNSGLKKLMSNVGGSLAVEHLLASQKNLLGEKPVVWFKLYSTYSRYAQDRFGGCSWRTPFKTVPTAVETGIALTLQSTDGFPSQITT